MRSVRATRSTRALSALALTTALALTAAACGSNDSNTAGSSSASSGASSAAAPSSTTEHNDADVAFATDMLPHHAQALTMVDLTAGRTLDPEVQKLADDIRAAQTPEIQTMTGWLTDWNKTLPDTSGSMDSMGSMDSSMPGMMSADDMTSLENASNTAFQTRWLELMVQHHEGAVEMAKIEIADGRYQPAIDLATSIVASQSKEIDTMKSILG